MTCRLCGGSTLRWGEGEDISLWRCRRCRFLSGEPRRELSPEERYASYYESEIPPVPERRYRQWLARAERVVGRGRLLEVGAGAGGLVRVAIARGWTVDATEVSASALPLLRETGARVFAGDLLAAGYPLATFDLVVSCEVLEHLSEPRPHLRELARVTRPGGLLLLTTPNFNGLSRRWLGVAWRVIGAEHLGYFTVGTLAAALRAAGYARVRIATRSLDVEAWRGRPGAGGQARYDPRAAAALRDAVEARSLLRLARATVNTALRATGLGDTLLVWARR